MDTGEDYFIHLQGEQKGPFTLRQIKHMYDRHFIPEETLYWHDGMEQWRHVSDLCGPPQWMAAGKRWIKPAGALISLAILVVLAKLFLPVTIEAWKESNQRGYTEEAAYWKARDYVRRGLKEQVDYVTFKPFEESVAKLGDGDTASVVLSGEKIRGKKAERRSWEVELRYSRQNRDWVGLRAVESP